ncbi:hypothetical protein CXB51_009499 [Gossypium anomalum]|uniref:RING-type E3 ubiquitin transferase n=1 Tax=Gossypium anomalum TaxID=47600 RepID=A0A8J6D9C1_9ROSI|nr:hypothetical protein CXB51_009499 [Gossypium anomalum]
MNTPFIFIFIFFFILFLSYTEATKCGSKGLNIKSPFTLSPHHNNDPNFNLYCQNTNTTMIHFPFYGTLVVKSISYNTRKLNLIDPKSCVHEVFLNLNLSLTPFRYYYVVKNYTYLNCSVPINGNSIPCLSGYGHHVYTVKPSVKVPDSCRAIKTVEIPFGYSSYLSDNSFGLGLTWELPKRDDEDADDGFEEERTWVHLTTKKVPMIPGLVLLAAVAMVMKMKILYTKKMLVSNEDMENQFSEDLLAQQHKIPQALE